jgi:hypothetical protein
MDWFTERVFALFASDVRISLVNAGLGRSTKSRSLIYDSIGKTSSDRRNFFVLTSRLNDRL